MTKRYKALKPVGPWSKGDTIGDLPQVQIGKQFIEETTPQRLATTELRTRQPEQTT